VRCLGASFGEPLRRLTQYARAVTRPLGQLGHPLQFGRPNPGSTLRKRECQTT
jgi:hypothetical protein